MKTVLFVCTGNTCRSPMAEAIFNVRAREYGLDVKACSCGIAAINGCPATEDAVIAASEYGADLSNHRSSSVGEDLLGQACAVYCMTSGHIGALKMLYPGYEDKLKIILPGGVTDPFLLGIDVYRQAAGQIAVAIDGILAKCTQDEDK